MNSYSTKEVIELLSKKAYAKEKLSIMRVILLGILAGAFIALGYLSFVRVAGTTPKEWGSFSTFLGACLFPIGLMAITFLGGELVTGNMMVMAFGWLHHDVKLSSVIKNWLLVMLGNFLGGLFVAYFFGHLTGLTEGDFAAKTIAVAASKVADTPVKMIISGIGCNIFVCMAVFLGAMSKDFMGKVFGLWFPIMLFVICGFQHVVANAFIIPAAMFAGAPISLSALFTDILFVFIGNALGGAIFLALPLYKTYFKPQEETEKIIERQVI